MSGLSIFSAPTNAAKSLVSSTNALRSVGGGNLSANAFANKLTNQATLSVVSSASPTTAAVVGGIAALATGKATGKTLALAAASAVGLNMNMAPKDAINTLIPGATQAISNAVSGALTGIFPSIGDFKIDFPSIQIPGLGQITMLIGAGKKFIADQLLKLKTIVPPFFPGLKINMAMVSAALSLVKAAMSGNLGAIAKSMLEDILEDLKESSGFNDLMDSVQDQISDVTSQISKLEDAVGTVAKVAGVATAVAGVIGGAKSSHVENYNKQNPPKVTYDEEGNQIVEQPPPPDTAVFDNATSILSPEMSGSAQESGSMVSGSMATEQVSGSMSGSMTQIATGSVEMTGSANVVSGGTINTRLSVSQTNVSLTGNQAGILNGTIMTNG